MRGQPAFIVSPPTKPEVVAAPLAAIVAAVRNLGVADFEVGFMPAGNVAIKLQVATLEHARKLAAALGMPEPQRAENDRSEWWHSEVGDYGFDRVSLTGGHRPLCQCHPRTGGVQ